MNAHVPFAVVGSTDFVRVGNKMMRSRQYPWGTVQGIILRWYKLKRSLSMTNNLFIFFLFQL